MSAHFIGSRWLPALFVFLAISASPAQQPSFRWTILVPEHDSRDADEQSYDDFDIRTVVDGMNRTEPIFHHQLLCDKTSIGHLLAAETPFCHLRFDAVRPLNLTAQEKAILTEYFRRGGFILLQQDCYPYNEDEFWTVKSWPVIDFLTRELPALSPDFKVSRITDSHAVFNQVYHTVTAESTQHELQGNPHTPNRTLLTYRGHPCALVIGRYTILEDGHWIAMPRPYEHVFSLDPRGYKLTVNIYIYATLH